MTITYGFLEEHPIYAEQLGEAIYYQWEEMYTQQGKTVAEVVETVKSRAISESIPCTMIALDGDTLLGSVTLKVNDFSDHPELSPWIAGVFVLPEHRGNGYGKGLVLHAEKTAAEKFDVKTTYLYTGSASELYKKIGYEVFETVDRGDKVLTLMKKELD